MFHQQNTPRVVESTSASQMCHINEINEKRVQNDGVLLPFQTSLPPGATLTRTRIAICAAISLQYICVSSGLRQEHEKWRRAQSSVPQIGVVYLTVNSFCVCVCVFVSVSICFHHLWKGGMTSLPTGAATAESCHPAPSSYLYLT